MPLPTSCKSVCPGAFAIRVFASVVVLVGVAAGCGESPAHDPDVSAEAVKQAQEASGSALTAVEPDSEVVADPGSVPATTEASPSVAIHPGGTWTVVQVLSAELDAKPVGRNPVPNLEIAVDGSSNAGERLESDVTARIAGHDGINRFVLHVALGRTGKATLTTSMFSSLRDDTSEAGQIAEAVQRVLRHLESFEVTRGSTRASDELKLTAGDGFLVLRRQDQPERPANGS